jgi:hypothetical protein
VNRASPPRTGRAIGYTGSPAARCTSGPVAVKSPLDIEGSHERDHASWQRRLQGLKWCVRRPVRHLDHIDAMITRLEHASPEATAPFVDAVARLSQNGPSRDSWALTLVAAAQL